MREYFCYKKRMQVRLKYGLLLEREYQVTGSILQTHPMQKGLPYLFHANQQFNLWRKLTS